MKKNNRDEYFSEIDIAYQIISDLDINSLDEYDEKELEELREIFELAKSGVKSEVQKRARKRKYQESSLKSFFIGTTAVTILAFQLSALLVFQTNVVVSSLLMLSMAPSVAVAVKEYVSSIVSAKKDKKLVLEPLKKDPSEMIDLINNKDNQLLDYTIVKRHTLFEKNLENKMSYHSPKIDKEEKLNTSYYRVRN